MEKGANGPERKRLVEKSLVKKGAVYGIDALFKNKEIQGVGQTRHKGVNTRTSEEWEYAGLPGHSYRRTDCPNYHWNHGSFDHAWELRCRGSEMPRRDQLLAWQLFHEKRWRG